MYNELRIIKNDQDEFDECLTKGICSINPGLSSLHEVVLLHLKELAFYLLKLNELGGSNNRIKEIVMDALFGIMSGIDYNQEQFRKIILELDEIIDQTKLIYKNYCEKHNIEAQFLKIYFKHTKELTLSDAKKKGEKYSLKKSNSLNSTQKNFYDIMLFLIKSMYMKILELQRFGKENDDNYYAILSLLNTMNIIDFSQEEIKEEIDKFMGVYYDAVVEVFHTQIELYGEVAATDVSFSTKPGKAILVSGSDYKKLENILKASENTEISIYTHGLEMLFAHAFPKLKSHPNLKGHFGTGLDSSLIDFAEFPGPILMTKLTQYSSESLYRGIMFTTDPITSSGIMKISDNDYHPLIQSALRANGFEHGREKPSMKVGYNELEIQKKLDEIIDNILNKKIKHLYIVGLFNYPGCCPKYFETFFKALPKDCFTISFSCESNKENVYYLNSYYELSLVLRSLKYLDSKIPLEEIPMSIFVAKCDKHTIASLLHLKKIGVRNVYLCKCPASLINPAIIKTLQEHYNIKEFTDARSDIKRTLMQE